MHRLFLAVVATAVVLFAASGCRDDDAARKITRSREIVADPSSVVVGATSAQRFGNGGFGRPHEEPQQDEVQRELVWDVPKGWKELPPTEMRRANLQPAGSPDAECALFVMPDDGGGLTANVNRWREKQFGLAPIADDDVAKLPQQKLFGLAATRVELEGTYQGMTAAGTSAEAKPGFAMIGLIAQVQDRSLFVKMTGPKALVESERARFDEFVKSLRIETPGAATTKESPHADPSAESTKPPAEFTFTAPAGWTATGHASTMRLATLVPNGAKQSECAIFVMPGSAGGIAGNVNRWRKQMGLAALTDPEVAALPKTPMLGGAATLVDTTGDFDDTMNQRSIAKARFLGAIVLLDAKTVFLKLTGPQSELGDEQRAQFLALCASMKSASGK